MIIHRAVRTTIVVLVVTLVTTGVAARAAAPPSTSTTTTAPRALAHRFPLGRKLCCARTTRTTGRSATTSRHPSAAATTPSVGWALPPLELAAVAVAIVVLTVAERRLWPRRGRPQSD